MKWNEGGAVSAIVAFEERKATVEEKPEPQALDLESMSRLAASILDKK